MSDTKKTKPLSKTAVVKTAAKKPSAKKTEPKTLGNSDASGAKNNVSDLKIVGNGDAFQLLCKASSEKEGWMKSTKAMPTPGGCIVQVTTQQRNPDGSYVCAEALCFVPSAQILDDVNGGRKLGRR